MKTLCPAILGLEAIVLLLAILVLLSLTTVGAPGAWALAALALLAVVGAGLFRRRPAVGLAVGWAVQGLAVLSALMVPAMLAVGIVFGALWWTAVHFGGKVDRLEAARARRPE